MNFKFNLKKTDLNLSLIRKEILFNIQKRQDLSVYEHFDISKVFHYEFFDLKNNDLPGFINILKHTWAIDINDFEIINKTDDFKGKLLVLFKKIIWKLLKFYTYRLFSQQREFNFQIACTIKECSRIFNAKVLELKNKIKKISSVKGAV